MGVEESGYTRNAKNVKACTLLEHTKFCKQNRKHYNEGTLQTSHDIHAELVLAGQFAAEFTGLGGRVTVLSFTLTRLKTVRQADGPAALTLVAHKLLIADGLRENERLI